MRPIASGTNTYAGFKRGDERCLELMRQADSLLVSVTVVGEPLAGFACGSQEVRNREELSHGFRGPAWARRGWNSVPSLWPRPTPTA